MKNTTTQQKNFKEWVLYSSEEERKLFIFKLNKKALVSFTKEISNLKKRLISDPEETKRKT